MLELQPLKKRGESDTVILNDIAFFPTPRASTSQRKTTTSKGNTIGLPKSSKDQRNTTYSFLNTSK